MGTPLIQQRRGKGSPTYRTPKQGFRPRIEYRKVGGTVKDIVRYGLTNSPLARVEYDDRRTGYLIAVEGMRVGDRVENYVMPVSDVPEGSQISSIETSPMSGPKLCRAPGTFAVIASKGRDTIIKMSSKKDTRIGPKCMVMVGRPAGEGRKEKPWIKAGKRWTAMHARGKLYPRTSGVAMNSKDHPYGGGYVGLGKHKSVSRHAPPGAKVGSLSPKRTGKRK
jgi:large subunit ribosomal protein L2